MCEKNKIINFPPDGGRKAEEITKQVKASVIILCSTPSATSAVAAPAFSEDKNYSF